MTCKIPCYRLGAFADSRKMLTEMVNNRACSVQMLAAGAMAW